MSNVETKDGSTLLMVRYHVRYVSVLGKKYDTLIRYVKLAEVRGMLVRFSNVCTKCTNVP